MKEEVGEVTRWSVREERPDIFSAEEVNGAPKLPFGVCTTVHITCSTARSFPLLRLRFRGRKVEVLQVREMK